MVYHPLAQTDADAGLENRHSRSPSPDEDDDGKPVSEPEIAGGYARPLSLDFSNLDSFPLQSSTTTGDGTALGSMLQSLRSPATTHHSYDVVEDDDYQVVDLPERTTPGPADGASNRNSNSNSSSRHSPRSPPPQPPIHTTSHSVALRHPTPDLQSLQGAYVGNIENLERSVEHMSQASDTQVEGELRRLDFEQKRRSISSGVGSAHSSQRDKEPLGSPQSLSRMPSQKSSRSRSSMPTSPASTPGRLRSTSAVSRLTVQVPESVEEHRDEPGPDERSDQQYPPAPEQHTPERQPVPARYARSRYSSQQTVPVDQYAPYAPEVPYAPSPFDHYQRQHDYEQQPSPERPLSAASGDTYRQGQILFKDFDGVHFVESRQVSLEKPPLARESTYFEVPPPEPPEGMVFYPAPVPMVLNLPPKISRTRPWYEEHLRRQHESAIPKVPQTPALLGKLEFEPVSERASQADRPSDEQQDSQHYTPEFIDESGFHLYPDLEIKDQSVVGTLESILDAAVTAPVNAFTDHPIVGHLGAEVYGREKPRRKGAVAADAKDKPKGKGKHSGSKLRYGQTADEEPGQDYKRKSRNKIRSLQGMPEDAAAANVGEDAPFRPSIDSPDAYENEQLRPSDQEDEDEDEDAEREDEEDDKEEEYVGAPTTLLAELQLRKQQQRTRNRTAGMAAGMHTTLLELDAVMQHQRQKRNRHQVRLAWEPPEPQDSEDEEEEVPLALLMSGKAREPQRPMGLMEKRDLEENEPLSFRRARMRGEPPPPPPQLLRATMTEPPQPPPLADSSDDDDRPGETLAARKRRLRSEEAGSEFANEILDMFEIKPGQDSKAETEKASNDDKGSNNGSDDEKEDSRENETLGQRRRRLQAEAEAADRLAAQQRRMTANPPIPAFGPHRQATQRASHISDGGAPPMIGHNPAPNPVAQRSSTVLAGPGFVPAAAAVPGGGLPAMHNPTIGGVRQSMSLANLLAVHPQRMQPSYLHSQMQQHANQSRVSMFGSGYARLSAANMSTPNFNSRNPYRASVAAPQFIAAGSRPNPFAVNGGATASHLSGVTGGLTGAGTGVPLDANRRSAIDQWRQGVV